MDTRATDATRALVAPRTVQPSARRKRSALVLAAVAVCCLSAVGTASAQEAGGAGSTAGSAGGVTGLPVTVAPTTAPTSKTPTFTTAAPTTKAPTVTTAAPTLAPETEAPVATTPAPEATVATEAPTVTAKPAKTKKNGTDTSASDAGPATAETAAPTATVLERSAADSAASSATAALSPASTPGSGVSYGGKSSDSSSSSSSGEASTKAASDSSKTAIQFVAVAAGVLGVVAAVAISVHFQQKRRALARDYDEDDKYLNPAPQRPTTIDVTAPTTTKEAAAAATSYDNFTTPQATAHGWRPKMTALNDPANHVARAPTIIAGKPVQEFNGDFNHPVQEFDGDFGKPVQEFDGEFRDSEDALAASTVSTDVLAQSTASGIVTTAAAAGSAATFVGRKAGENDVTGGEDADRATSHAANYEEENFREPRVTVKHITRCRGQSEASTADGSDGLSQYGNGLLRSTFLNDDHDDDEGYTNTQMFAFSDSGSECDRDSSRSHASEQARGPGGAASDVSEFLKYYNEPIVNTKSVEVDVDGEVDVDVDDDEEDIVGRSTRASSLFDDVRASDFTVSHDPRMSTSSSIADFHDSMADRPSELDEEEFEV